MCDAPSPVLGDPLDIRQVERITAVHNGFLFQHLYGVACLLTVIRNGGTTLVVERDEDLELKLDGRSPYVQVKVRNRPLQYGDIESALAQFATIRMQHEAGRRTGTPSLQIVSNSAPGPGLAAQLAADNWPSDIRVVSPGDDNGDLPPAWENVTDAFSWCVERARQIPFRSLAPETLVWKLAALIHHAAAGGADRTFVSEQLPQLLEQLVLQLQDFPDPPENYRPQIDEPMLVADARLRIVVGFSGAGKTAWASQSAMHCPDPVAYIDIGEMPAASVAPDVARELAARFLGGRAERFGSAVIADQSGLNVLRATDRLLTEQGVRVQVILDNAHRVEAAVIRSLVHSAPGLRFLCLAQPWNGAAALEAHFGVEAERLLGWNADDVAAEFATAGATVDVPTAQRIIRLTAGMPLYIQSAARLSVSAYNGNGAAFCDALENRTNHRETAQEIILRDAFECLDDDARRVATVLSMSDVTLAWAELETVIGALLATEARAAGALRSLRRSSMVIGYQGDRFALHDALRPLALDEVSRLPDGAETDILNRLTDAMINSIRHNRDIPRFSFMLRLLPRVGRTEVLVDLAAFEMFHEQGDPRSLRAELQRAADDESASAYDKFWAHDALAYWESRDGGQPSRERLDVMHGLLEEGQLSELEQLNFSFKELAYWGTEGDRGRINQIYAAAMRLGSDAETKRLLRYNYAVALRRAGAALDARRVIDVLIEEYFRIIGMREPETFGRNPAQLNERLRGVDRDDIKRTADALSLWCHLAIDLDEPPLLRRITAMKLYQQVLAARSIVQLGIEVVDDFLTIMGDAIGARETMEQHVLPLMRESELTDLILSSRSHYAIVLAWNRDVPAARREMAALQQYAVTREERAMLAERSHAIEQIASGELRLVRRVPPPDAMARIMGAGSRQIQRVGRNDPCPCGSGLKYKRCCGRS